MGCLTKRAIAEKWTEQRKQQRIKIGEKAAQKTADLLAEKKGGLTEALALIAWMIENVEQYDRKQISLYVAQYLQSKGVSVG